MMMRVVVLHWHRRLFFEYSKGPFLSSTQRRWRGKPSESAQTRLQDHRTRDAHFDKLASHLKTLSLVLTLTHLLARKRRGHFVSLQIMSRWKALAGLNANVRVGEFLRGRPHVFDIFPHPERCCRVSAAMLGLLRGEESVVRASESEAAKRVERLLMMSASGTLHVHSLRLVRRELGLPEDFRESILGKYDHVFKLVGSEVVELVKGRDYHDVDCEAHVEKWREREYRERWLSEFETKFAFPINFPTGFRIVPGLRDKLKNWQRLPYAKPYDRREVVRAGGVDRYEKRAVGILHELLSLTVEKMVEVERLAHFRRDFRMEVNVRELLLKHPGIFYVSIKGGTQRVFLREAYRHGCLVESNPIYDARRKILGLVLLGRRHSRGMRVSDGNAELVE